MDSVVNRQAAVPAVRRDSWGTISYVFMRVSGLLLFVLVIGHFAIQHVVNDVHNLSIDFVAQRWASLGWRVYDAFLLGLALIHGLNGLRYVVNDYILNATWNRIIKILILLVGLFLIIVGSVAIIGGVRPVR